MCNSECETNDLKMFKDIANDIRTLDGVRNVKIHEYRCVVIEVAMTGYGFGDSTVIDKIYELEYNALQQKCSDIGFDIRLNIVDDY